MLKLASNRDAAVANLWVAREEEGSWSLPFKRHFQDSKFGSCDEIYGAHPQDENAKLGEDSIL